MRSFILLAFILLVLASVSSAYQHRPYNRPRFRVQHHRYTQTCCIMKNYFFHLFLTYRRNCPIFQMRSFALKRALNRQIVVVRQVPMRSMALTKDYIDGVKVRGVTALNSLTTSEPETTTAPEATTPQPATTQMLNDSISEEEHDLKIADDDFEDDLDSFASNKNEKSEQYHDDRNQEDDLYGDSKDDGNDSDDDRDDDDDNNDEDNNDDDNDGGENYRKRRDLADSHDKHCPKNPRRILASLGRLPYGTRAVFVKATKTHERLNNILVRSCAECRYKIILPRGFSPRYHPHVICTKAKRNCMGGLGKCTKLQVRSYVIRDYGDYMRSHRMTFNKGCSCSLLKAFTVLTDGNEPRVVY